MNAQTRDENIVIRRILRFIKAGAVNHQDVMRTLKKEANEHQLFEASIRTLCTFSCEHKSVRELKSILRVIKDPTNKKIVRSLLLPNQRELSLAV